MFLWILLWSGYNTGIYVVQAPNFPADTLQLVQGIRAFFPLVAGWLAIVTLLRKGGARLWALVGPVGLLGVFTAAGLLSSGLISKYPLDALYWGGMYGAVLIVLVAVCSDADAVPILSRVITVNWMIDILILLGLLGAIPFLGGAALSQAHGNPLGLQAYAGQMAANGTILGMASTRNTGLARYAAVAGLVALGRLWKENLFRKLIWVAVLLVALYTLVLAQARTETIGFLAGLMAILVLRKSRRTLLLGAGTLGVVLLYLVGFFHDLWVFGTQSRGGHGFDPTLTGRTNQWMQGLAATLHSPWLGLGFQADRYYLHGVQLENAVSQALIQAGILGTVAFVAAFALAWYMLVRLYTSKLARQLPDEIPGILVFFTVMSITESTVYYSADWLLLAPVLGYIQVLAWQQGIVSFGAITLGHRAALVNPRTSAEDLR
ncbi:MAG TPA: O-antigen ligase family protein [Candidatus Dormibacteraeota bacterium]|nr:O-antigen ligase family protein [Candidatus Dormibacteraeota bacterium]